MDFENMSKEELIEYIKNLDEEHSGKYGLVWDMEKVPEQIVVDCNKYIPVLKEVEDKNIDNGGNDNILIEGDNFHSLSVLNYTHKEAIDVIYIDQTTPNMIQSIKGVIARNPFIAVRI